MALKAGHKGIKNTLKLALEKLVADTAGMKIIKTIGDGLQLTDAGKLNVKAATASAIGGIKVGEGLEIEDGVLNVTASGGIDYSTEKQDTGLKWTDGKTIYQKTYVVGDASSTKVLVDTLTNLSTLISCTGIWNYKLNQQDEIRTVPHFASSSTMLYPIVDKADSNKLYLMVGTAANSKGIIITIQFTENEQTEQEG